MGLPPFQRLLEEHGPAVYRFLVATAGPGEAEDCFQETFLAALRGYPRLRPDSNLRAWLMTIARRKAVDAHRSRRRRPEPVEVVPDRAGEGQADGDPGVWRRVRGLPPRQREAVVLRFVGDLPYREVALAMGSSEAAARQNVRLALRSLKEEIA
jgi:DNA-directed RNA polymerase specialized sigma24 family protein